VPIDIKTPFCSYWVDVDPSRCPDGPVEREIYPEDLMLFIMNGYSPDEIAESLFAPIDAIEHAIMLIPKMMAWRRDHLAKESADFDAKRLPSLSEEYRVPHARDNVLVNEKID